MNTVAIYLKYRTERQKIRARQRVELENELLTVKLQLGEAFMFEQDKNRLKIDDIMALIGTKNRRLFYDMTRLYKAAQTPKESQPEPVEIPDDVTEQIEWFTSGEGNNWGVNITVNGEIVEEYDIAVINGSLNLPDSWATHERDRRALYAKFIKAVS